MRPNVLYIHSHDTGRYIQPYGHAVPTPRLAQLAGQGVLFRQAFCAAPTCSASRAALLTGMHPHCCGMLGLAHRGWSLNDYGRTMIRALGGAGYQCALSGIQHIFGSSRQTAAAADTLGYHRILDRPDEGKPLNPNATHDRAAAFLRARPQEPFFLDVGFGNTHRPFPSDVTEAEARYVRVPAPLPDHPQTRLDMAAFYRSAAELDAKIGTVLDALDEAGLAHNTLVICTTDHGIAFPLMKCNLTDHGLGVMLMLRGPGGLEGGRVVDAPVSHMDVFPTVCEVTGLAPPAWLQGRSLLPLVRGEADSLHDCLFGEVTYHAAYEPMRSARTDRWKYIRRFGERRRPVMPNCDNGPSKSLLMANGWRDRVLPTEELYDLVFDPNESHNLAFEPSCATALEQMRGRMDRWMKATTDPLLDGPVGMPRGAVTSDPDAIDPEALLGPPRA